MERVASIASPNYSTALPTPLLPYEEQVVEVKKPLMVGERSLEEMPSWLEALLSEKFFSPCSVHEGFRKSEKNIMCLDCCSSFCPSCLPLHPSHRLLQIRRYVYRDVARVEDLERLFDLDFIQMYTINSKKVVFINERNQGRQINERSVLNRPINQCLKCERWLHQDHYLYCSLSCKVKKLLSEEGGLTRHLRKCGPRAPPASLDLDECQLSPDSILEATSSGSSGSGSARAVVRRRRSYSYRLCRAEPVEPRRRKQSNPQRSSLF